MQNSNNELVTRTNGNRLALPDRSMTPVSVAEHLELTVREVAEMGRGENAAQQREREDSVEYSRVIAGEANADPFHHQRIDDSEAEAEQKRPQRCAEPVVGARQQQTAECRTGTAPDQEFPVTELRGAEPEHDAPGQQRQPVDGEHGESG